MNRWQGGIYLINGLKSHPHLNNLDLSFNGLWLDSCNKPDPNATLALANALMSWPHLRNLRAEGNHMGYQSPESASYFLDKLADFAKSRGGNFSADLLDAIDLDRINWTDEAENFVKLVQKSVQDKCEAEICASSSSTTDSATSDNFQHANEQQMTPIIDQAQQSAFQERSLPSRASRATPFLTGWINYAASWFSPQAWKNSFNQGLDFVAQSILKHSKSVVEDCPSYFPNNPNVLEPSFGPDHGSLSSTSVPALPLALLK